jgi:hypothetical protein
MYKACSYLVITYFLTYLPIYEIYFDTKLVTNMKPNINSVVKNKPQLSNNGHWVDGALSGAGSLCGQGKAKIHWKVDQFGPPWH